MTPTNWFGEEEEDTPKPWTLAEIYADLGAIAEIIADLNINRHRMTNWIERQEHTKCPKPVARLGNVKIYSKQEWRDWFAAWNAKHNPETKWTNKAMVHGQGENFFTYDRKTP